MNEASLSASPRMNNESIMFLMTVRFSSVRSRSRISVSPSSIVCALASWIGHSILDANGSWTFRTENGRSEQLAVSPRVVVSTAEAMRTLAEPNVGLAVLPLHMVRDPIARGHLIHCCPAWYRRKMASQLVTPTRQVPPRVAAFIALARGVAKQLGF